jgi:RNA polymerase sigma-70 factor (ECF subfamily)
LNPAQARPGSLGDAELAALVVGSGHQAAFQELVVRHQGLIRAFLRRLAAGDLALADDLAQDTFLLAYRKMHTWSGRGKFSSWLHTIAYRQFIQHTRKNGRQTVMQEVPDVGHDERDAVEAELALQKLMAQVGPEERACLTLAYAAGMSHDEISRITGLPLGTVKSRIHRGKLKLQAWVKSHDHSSPQEAQSA